MMKAMTFSEALLSSPLHHPFLRIMLAAVSCMQSRQGLFFSALLLCLLHCQVCFKVGK